MRLPDSQSFRRYRRVLLTTFVAAGVSACGSARDSGLTLAAAPAGRTGPQADYPIQVGDPYVIGGMTHTPVDVLNYDEVGYLAVDDGALGYSGAHHTLPIPSYAEVTSLETGRTVLVRLERRGPMASNHVVALAPAALAQLGASAETPIRIRRVNPPEEHRALLRAGNAAPLRMDTPMALVTVLQRRLPQVGSAPLNARSPLPRQIETVDLAASTAAPAPVPPPVELPPVAAVEPVPPPVSRVPALPPIAAFEPAPAPVAVTVPAPVPAAAPAPAAEGRFVVQAAAFASADNARRAANVLGGEIVHSGNLYRVRTGPFATRGEAEASLAIVRRAGYSDARILTSG